MFYWHTHPYFSRQQVVAFLELSKEQGHYDVFVTIDQGFELEHNLKKLSFGFLIIHVPKNTLEFYEAIEAPLRNAVTRVKAGQAVHVYSEESDYVSPPSTASPGLLGESRQLPTTPAAAPSPDPPPSLAAPAASTPPALPTPSGIMPART